MGETDLISRQAAIDAIYETFCYAYCDNCEKEMNEDLCGDCHRKYQNWAASKNIISKTINSLPSAQPEVLACGNGELIEQPEQQWIPCSERPPKELEVVNVTWVNHEPEPYYESIKDVPFTASAVYYRGKWYWYSSITVDVLAEYGKYESEEFDDAIECIAWMPLPEPWKGEQP